MIPIPQYVVIDDGYHLARKQSEMSRHSVPARKGAGYRLETGQTFKVINTHGTQVVDFWAVSLDDPTE
jgi:uncharacterized protein YcgI (DUF1989 family)